MGGEERRTVTIRDWVIYVSVCVELWVSSSGVYYCAAAMTTKNEASIDCEEESIGCDWIGLDWFLIRRVFDVLPLHPPHPIQ